MALQNCCGCCSLKTGALIIAIFTLIQVSISVITVIAQSVTPTSSEYVPPEYKTLYVYLIGPSIIQFLIALCLIYGVAKEKKYFILPTLIVNMIAIVVYSIAAIYIAVVVHPAFLLLFVVVVFEVYLWYVIFSFYKYLSESDATATAPYSTLEGDRNV